MIEKKMSDKESKRAGQIINAALEVLEAYPDNNSKYTAFMAGAIWADNKPASDNEWHKVGGDGVDPTKECYDKSDTIIYIDGDRDIFTITIGTIKDVYLTFDHFISIHNVCYWAYARALVPNAIYDELSKSSGDNRFGNMEED